MNDRDRQDQQDRVFGALDIATKPLQMLSSFLEGLFFLLILIGIGLFYPLIQLCNGYPVTLGSFMVSFLTIVAIFTMFYAPRYFFICGFFFFGWIVNNADNANRYPSLDWITPTSDIGNGWPFKLAILGFFAVGILQSYLIRRMRRIRKPKPVPSEPQQYRRRSEAQPVGNIKGGTADNGESSPSRSTGNVVCQQCANGYRLLSLPFGASCDAVNSQRLALSEVLHPDRLGDKSERARHAAEEQLKSINEACSHMLQCTASR